MCTSVGGAFPVRVMAGPIDVPGILVFQRSARWLAVVSRDQLPGHPDDASQKDQTWISGNATTRRKQRIGGVVAGSVLDRRVLEGP